MKELVFDEGRFRYYSPEETARDFAPLRDRIFYFSGGEISCVSERIFRDATWIKVIIQGGLMFSDRSPRPDPHDPSVMVSDPDDPRDELQPLFETLAEDGIDEIIHMSPYAGSLEVDTAQGSIVLPDVAVGTDPNGKCTRTQDSMSNATFFQKRLLFDGTGRWGLYASWEMFGLLGGEPAFMARFVEKSGGWDFIRRKADAYWKKEVDRKGHEAALVPHYYALAGWDNPPAASASPR
jgi:hypothetical protein